MAIGTTTFVERRRSVHYRRWTDREYGGTRTLRKRKVTCPLCVQMLQEAKRLPGDPRVGPGF